ncbi:MAG: tyrosine recombinase XerS, partial [Lactococcus raffinolactis]|nr:tyrosine recombinase XerS [Lactococcus raffinolactis]
MKRERLIENIEDLKIVMPDFVLEYYRSKSAVPYSLNTLYEYLKEYQRFFSWLMDA